MPDAEFYATAYKVTALLIGAGFVGFLVGDPSYLYFRNRREMKRQDSQIGFDFDRKGNPYFIKEPLQSYRDE